MSWKNAVGAVVLAGALTVPVGAALAHGHKPTSHPSGPPPRASAASSIASPPSGPPSTTPDHGHGRGASASHIPPLVQTDQQLQRQIVATRFQIVALMQQIRAALVADEQAGNTTAVMNAATTLKTAMSTARTALYEARLAQDGSSGPTGSTSSSSTSLSGAASPSGGGSTAALTNIATYRTAELQALM